jgi:hypothetical protein
MEALINNRKFCYDNYFIVVVVLFLIITKNTDKLFVILEKQTSQ